MDGHQVLIPSMTIDKCFDICKEKSFRYAGLQNGGACKCDYKYDKYGPSDKCRTKCNGDNNQICGGPLANSVYRIDGLRGDDLCISVGQPLPSSSTGYITDNPSSDTDWPNADVGDVTPQLSVWFTASDEYSHYCETMDRIVLKEGYNHLIGKSGKDHHINAIRREPSSPDLWVMLGHHINSGCKLSQLSDIDTVSVLSEADQEILEDFTWAEVQVQSDFNVSMSATDSNHPAYVDVIELSGERYKLDFGDSPGYTHVELDDSKERFQCTSGYDGNCGRGRLPKNSQSTQRVFITDIHIDSSGGGNKFTFDGERYIIWLRPGTCDKKNIPREEPKPQPPSPVYPDSATDEPCPTLTQGLNEIVVGSFTLKLFAEETSVGDQTEPVYQIRLGRTSNVFSDATSFQDWTTAQDWSVDEATDGEYIYDLLSYDAKVFIALYQNRLQLNKVDTDVTLLLQSDNSINPSYVDAIKIGAGRFNRRHIVRAAERCDGDTKIEFDSDGRIKCTGCQCGGLNNNVRQKLLVSRVHLVPRGNHQYRSWSCNNDGNKVSWKGSKYYAYVQCVEKSNTTTTEGTTQLTTEITTESATELTTERTTELTTESTNELTTESTNELTTESTNALTTKNATEPTIKSTTEPRTKDMTEPTNGLPTELTTELTTVPTTEFTVNTTASHYYTYTIEQNANTSSTPPSSDVPNLLPGCPAPALMSNARWYMDSAVTPYGSVVHVQCKVGYIFPDGSSRRTFVCNNGGKWHVPVRDCKAVHCSKGLQSGNIRRRRCTGDGERLASGLTEGEAECSARGKLSHNISSCHDGRCAPAPMVENALAVISTTDAGSVVIFTCILGYRFPDGYTTHQIVCDKADQTWRPETLPACLPITCPPVPRPRDAQVNSTSAIYETYVAVTCAPGHAYRDFNGTAVIRCQHDGQWTNTSALKCYAITCPPLPSVTHGVSSSVGEGQYNDTVTLRCDPPANRTLHGHTGLSATCGPVGEWNVSMKRGGEWSCNENRCPPVPALMHASVSSLVAERGSEVVYTCDEGYSSQAAINITCTELLQWTEINDSCQPLYCPHLPSYNHAVTSSSSSAAPELIAAARFPVTSTVTITCFTGYCRPSSRLDDDRLTTDEGGSVDVIESFYDDARKSSVNEQEVHSEVLECLPTQQWNSSTDDCEPVSCLTPARIANGYSMYVGRNVSENDSVPSAYIEERWTYGALVTYRCNTGFMFAGRRREMTMMCMDTGEWSLQPTDCRELHCPPLPVWEGTIEANSTKTGYRAVVNYTCVSGENVEQNVDIGHVTQCEANAEWSPSIVNCKAVKSKHLELPPTEDDQAAVFGSIILIVLGTVLMGVTLFDVLTLSKDMPILKENFRGLRENIKDFMNGDLNIQNPGAQSVNSGYPDTPTASRDITQRPSYYGDNATAL